ncbi:MAG TPA: glutaredoxin family protein [Chthoniobacterales bacterium]
MLKVYIKPGCSWCIEAVEWLQKRGYAFEEIDVFDDPRDFDRMRQISGQSRAPTLETEKGLVLADFDVKQLATFLAANELTPP